MKVKEAEKLARKRFSKLGRAIVHKRGPREVGVEGPLCLDVRGSGDTFEAAFKDAQERESFKGKYR